MGDLRKMKEAIINTILVLSIILLVVFLAWYMFGNSPTWEQILIVFVLPMATAMFSIYERLNTKIDLVHTQISDIKVSLAKIETRLST